MTCKCLNTTGTFSLSPTHYSHYSESNLLEETNNLRCKCAKVEMEVECGETNDWSCDQVCSKLKDCRNHECLK